MKFDIEKPEIEQFIQTLERCGQVVSVFMKFSPSVMPSRECASLTPLQDLLHHPEFKNDCAALGKISSNEIHYSTLNRMEFEGSLASVLIEGGCFRNSTLERKARQIVGEVLNAVFPIPFDSLLAFRIDNPSWCEFTTAATVSYSYIAWEGARGVWWILSVADED